jgi:hypothetical protein
MSTYSISDESLGTRRALSLICDGQIVDRYYYRPGWKTDVILYQWNKNFLGTPLKSGSVAFSPQMQGWLQGAAGESFHPGGNPFGAVGWFNFNPAAGQIWDSPIMGVFDAITNNREWMLMLPDLDIEGRISSDGASSLDVCNYGVNTATAGIWTMGAMTWDGSSILEIYTNTAVYESSSATFPIFNGGKPFKVGAFNHEDGTTKVFSGKIAGLRIYNRHITGADITNLWNGGKYLPYSSLPAGLKTGLVHDWPLSEALPGPWHDMVPGGFNLIASGVVSTDAAPPM